MLTALYIVLCVLCAIPTVLFIVWIWELYDSLPTADTDIICIDCKYCDYPNRCWHPKMNPKDAVSGETGTRDCRQIRNSDCTACGPKGKLFVNKNSSVPIDNR
jgi:hypothetical protein